MRVLERHIGRLDAACKILRGDSITIGRKA